MSKEKFDIIQSTCLPIEIDNCNTDLIIPARYLASTTRDPKFFGDAFMHDLRYDAEGKPVGDFRNNLLNCFVLPVVVSREFQQELFQTVKDHPQAEVKVDVPNQTVTNLTTGHSEQFPINSYKKYCLMNAYDDIDFLLANKEKILNFEDKRR